MDLIAQGFSIRREHSCIDLWEVDCGARRAPFRACCPAGLVCQNNYNTDCCLPGKNCTVALYEEKPQPRCANATWDLFDNQGLFCCEPGRQALDRDNGNLCVEPGFTAKANDTLLKLIRKGEDPNLFTSSANGTPTPSNSGTPSPSSTTADPAPSPNNNSNNPSPNTPSVGTIVGGVAGGVVFLALIFGIAWWMRKKNPNTFTGRPAELYDARSPEHGAAGFKYAHHASSSDVHQADSRNLHEADGAAPKYGSGAGAQEMPGATAPVELAAGEPRTQQGEARV